MKLPYHLTLIFFLFLLLSCQNAKDLSAIAYIEASVEAHGMTEFNKKSIDVYVIEYGL